MILSKVVTYYPSQVFEEGEMFAIFNTKGHLLVEESKETRKKIVKKNRSRSSLR